MLLKKILSFLFDVYGRNIMHFFEKTNIFKFKNAILIIALFFSFIANVSVTDGKELISDKSFHVFTKEVGRNLEFYISNMETFDMTVTIEFSVLDGLRADVLLPYINTISGEETIKAFMLSPVDENKGGTYTFSFFWVSGIMNAKHDDTFIYSLPYEKGSTYRVSQAFGGSFSHFGNEKCAIDFVMPEGTPICAARGGKVIGVRDYYSGNGIDELYKNRNNYIMIRHSDGTTGEYKHIKTGGAKVKTGDIVEQGNVIALSGNVGYSTAPHLHFFVYKAIDGKTRETIPVKFRTTESDAEILEAGQCYTSP